jgi:uncharacterized RDD family membrane protein YckC
MADIASAPQRPRAGFWRRIAAALIDGLVVSVPIQLVVVVLFAMTNGAVQTTSGFTTKKCSRDIPIAELPKGLDPPPPERANHAEICRTSFFGLETARRLTVSRTTQDGIVKKTFSYSYMLDAGGRPINGTSLDWVVVLALATYLIALEHRLGKTVGKGALGLRVADTLDMERIGIPLRKAVIRNVMIWSWAFPMLIVLLVGLLLTGDMEGLLDGSFFTWFTAAGLLSLAWLLWMVIQIGCKLDPAYDRIAGTAVLRV